MYPRDTYAAGAVGFPLRQIHTLGARHDESRRKSPGGQRGDETRVYAQREMRFRITLRSLSLSLSPLEELIAASIGEARPISFGSRPKSALRNVSIHNETAPLPALALGAFGISGTRSPRSRPALKRERSEFSLAGWRGFSRTLRDLDGGPLRRNLPISVDIRP